jgi:hypothetical protein
LPVVDKSCDKLIFTIASTNASAPVAVAGTTATTRNGKVAVTAAEAPKIEEVAFPVVASGVPTIPVTLVPTIFLPAAVMVELLPVIAT